MQRGIPFMLRGDLTVAPPHHQITNVHNDCIFQRRGVNEFAWYTRILDLAGVRWGLKPCRGRKIPGVLRSRPGTAL